MRSRKFVTSKNFLTTITAYNGTAHCESARAILENQNAKNFEIQNPRILIPSKISRYTVYPKTALTAHAQNLRSRYGLQPLGQRSNCCRSRKSIRGHEPMFNLFPVYNSFLLQALSQLYFTSTTPNIDLQKEQPFLSPVVLVV